jgi:hypothetical protein
VKLTNILLISLLLTGTATVFAQDAQEDLARDAANPIANLISFPIQNNADYGLGPYNRTANVMNIQPVIPLAQGKWITRTIFPFAWVPDVTQETGTLSSGLSDILFTAFYVPGKGSTMWGVGPVLEFPTGGEIRGNQKWSAGLSGVLLAQPGPWTLGLLANNVWSFAGDSDAADVNKGLLQYFIVYQLGNGWYLNSAPILTVDWNASEGNKWKVPFGAGGGKLMFWGKLPANLQTQVYYYVESPQYGPEWQWRIQLQFFLPMPGGGN